MTVVATPDNPGPTASPNLRAAKYFLVVLTPLLILLTLILWHFLQMERDKTYIEIKTLESQRLAAEQKRISREFQIIVGDLFTLAGQNEIHHFADTDDQAILEKVAREYLLISKSKGTYDQIRFIDDKGWERVRVNFNNGTPTVAPRETLQNMSSRHFFQETLQLPQNTIFTSTLDLDEEGESELPLKPVIRFGTPVFDSRGQRKGIILLNYLARMTPEPNERFGAMMLTNADGACLYCATGGKTHKFITAAGKKRIFADTYPQAWQKMTAGEAGSFFTSNGFFTFQRIHPLQKIHAGRQDSPRPANQSPTWILISRLPPQRIAELTDHSKRHFFNLFALLVQGALISAVLITWALLKRKAAEQAAVAAREQKEEFILRRAQQDNALAELSANLLAQMSIQEIADTVINKSQMLTNSRFAFAGYIDHDTGNLVCPSMINDIMAECKLTNQELIFSKCAGLWGWVLENRQAILANDPLNDPRSTGLPTGHIPVRRFLSVPAMINDELVGIIALANSDRDYTERDLHAISRIATLFALSIQHKRSGESIHRLLMGTAAVTGEQFFDTMVEQLAKCLGTKYVLVGEILPESPHEIHGLAFWNGDALGKPLHYALAGTPCEEVRKGGFCVYEKNVANLFPEDKALTELQVEFYAGIPLRDTAGAAIGILCALHDAPLRPTPHITEIFQIFSNRTSGEIERQRVEKSLALAKEAAESANKAKSRFLAHMSHELRTPLNAIIGFAAVLLEQHFGPLNQKQLDYTKEIRHGGDHLLAIINDILDLAKIEAGKMPFTKMPAQIAPLVEQCLTIIKDSAAKNAITIDLAVAPELTDLILDIDERKLKQAILNLLANAVKFTPDNGRITVALQRDEETLSISITDSGIGIDKKDITRIFEPFYQVKNEYRGKTPGTGLGLPLTKTLVEMHQGTLQVTSEGIDKGTCFTITLPIKKSRLAGALPATS